MKYYFRGGIGDLLQSLWFMQLNPEKEYIVHSHFKKIKDIFDFYGIKNSYFNNFETHNDQVEKIKEDHAAENQNDILEIPRAYYSVYDFGKDSEAEAENLINSFKNKNQIIGIHPFRSDFAQSVYEENSLPAKVLPVEIVKDLISENKNYLIYGLKYELASYGIPESENVKHVNFDNILSSLSTIKYCDCVISLDSCFKTASSMQRINTICLIGDFKDSIRDACFINQYVKDGVMKVFKTKNTYDDKDEIIKFIKENI